MEGGQENGVKKGPWSVEEDRKLINCVEKHGQGNWQRVPQLAELNRCGKSCRLRWTNYLKPGIKRGGFSEEEEATIIALHRKLGNKWSTIAAHLPRRTDNEIKNYWNTHLRKKLLRMGIDPKTHKPIPPDLNNFLLNLSQAQILTGFANSNSNSNLYSCMNPLDAAAALSLQAANANDLIKIQILHNIMKLVNPSPLPYLQGNLAQFSNHFSAVDPLQLQAHSAVTPLPTDMTSFSALLLNQQQPSASNSFPWFEGSQDNVKGSDSNANMNPECCLPSLVSITPETSAANQPESIQQGYMNTDRPHDHDQETNVFDAWENLMDDEANSSFWKNILG